MKKILNHGNHREGSRTASSRISRSYSKSGRSLSTAGFGRMEDTEAILAVCDILRWRDRHIPNPFFVSATRDRPHMLNKPTREIACMVLHKPTLRHLLCSNYHYDLDGSGMQDGRQGAHRVPAVLAKNIEVWTAEPDGRTSALFSRRTKTNFSSPIHHNDFHTQDFSAKIGNRIHRPREGSPRDMKSASTCQISTQDPPMGGVAMGFHAKEK